MGCSRRFNSGKSWEAHSRGNAEFPHGDGILGSHPGRAVPGAGMDPGMEAGRRESSASELPWIWDPLGKGFSRFPWMRD